MSLSRAFTTKKAKKIPEISAPMPQRSLTTKFAAGSIRNKISGPVELLSTTNMLSYSAPDLYPSQQVFSPSTPPSLTNSSSSSARSISSEELSVDASSPPTSPEADGRSPSPNHLSCYFEKRESTSSGGDNPSAPSIPQRAPSHTKRNHEILHRKRSISRMSQRSHSVKNSISSFTREARDSFQMFSATPELMEDTDDAPISTGMRTPEQRISSPIQMKKSSLAQLSSNPFGAELAQVTELAEEFSGVKIVDEEEQDLVTRGFYKFGAQDYMAEIEVFRATAYGPLRIKKETQQWI